MLVAKKKGFVFFFILFLSIFFSVSVNAIGISPADAYVNFVPNHEYVIDYSITSYRPFEFTTEGPFSEFTRVETNRQSDTQGNFRVYLTLPESYETPGKHRMYVAAREKSSPGTINTIAGIRGFIEIDVPFPGYYAEMDVHATNVNVGEPVLINIDVRNKGKLNISNARLQLQILDDEKSIKTIDSETFAINTTNSFHFGHTIPGNELKPGTYRLKVNLFYEGSPQGKIEIFRVGTFDVNIINYTDNMYNNSVNPFEIEIESLWNNRINKVFMDLSIMDGAKTLSTVTTPPFDLPAWERKTSSFYWNTKDIPVGEYDLKIVLHYGDEVRTENRKIYIVERTTPEVETPIPVATIVLILIAILLIGFNIYFIFVIRKKKEENKEEKKET